MHPFMEAALHQQQRVLPHKVGYGARVAALEQFPFVLQDETIGLRVGGEHGRLSEHVSCEYGSEPGHALVDERFGVLSLVG